MSKKYKGKLCAYCSEATAITGDHIFAREFFLPEDRDNLPQAPICEKCNAEKAELEHYLTALLPFGARHHQASRNLMERVPRRLDKNRKLAKQISESIRPAWIKDGSGLFLPTATVNFDSSRLDRLLRFVVRGLAWHHWKTYITPEDYVEVMLLTEIQSVDFLDRTSRWHAAHRFLGNFGNGTVQYRVIQAAEPAGLTAWAMSVYGGVAVPIGRIQEGFPREVSTVWWVVTAPKEVSPSLQRFSDHPGQQTICSTE